VARVKDDPTSATVASIDLDAPLPSAGGPFAFDPALPPPFDVAPPLSIQESRLMLRDATALLSEAAGPAKSESDSQALSARAARADFMLVSVARYVRWIDQAHATLPYYRWIAFDDAKVQDSTTRVYVLKGDKAIGNVTALALRAHHSDVAVEQVAVTASDRKQWLFNQPIALQADQPRSEICFLAVPVKLKSVALRCRQAGEDATRRPRVFVLAGVCARPESAKQAVYYIQRARDDLRHGRWGDARANLALAMRSLLEYQQDRRL
jgi:hypothetical protein